VLLKGISNNNNDNNNNTLVPTQFQQTWIKGKKSSLLCLGTRTAKRERDESILLPDVVVVWLCC